MNNDIQNETMSMPVNGPGRRLKLAREASSKTTSQAAAELNLTAEIITAIEAEDYAKFSNFMFVRGYLRSYAKLMRLPADEIVDEFNQLNLIERPKERLVSINLQRNAKTHKYHAKHITSVIAAVLAVLLISWWFTHGRNNSEDSLLPLMHQGTAESKTLLHE